MLNWIYRYLMFGLIEITVVMGLLVTFSEIYYGMKPMEFVKSGIRKQGIVMIIFETLLFTMIWPYVTAKFFHGVYREASQSIKKTDK